MLPVLAKFEIDSNDVRLLFGPAAVCVRARAVCTACSAYSAATAKLTVC